MTILEFVFACLFCAPEATTASYVRFSICFAHLFPRNCIFDPKCRSFFLSPLFVRTLENRSLNTKNVVQCSLEMLKLMFCWHIAGVICEPTQLSRDGYKLAKMIVWKIVSYCGLGELSNDYQQTQTCQFARMKWKWCISLFLVLTFIFHPKIVLSFAIGTEKFKISS